MSDKLYIAKVNWQQDYPEMLAFMQPFIEEWERIQLEQSDFQESQEIIERIKNGNDC